VIDAAPTLGTEEPTPRASIARALARRPAAAVSLLFLALLTLACVMAPLIAPHEPLRQDLAHVLSRPTSTYLLGTDSLGRDVLSRLMYGGRRSLLSSAEAVAVVLLLGVPVGLVAGYARGGFDWLTTRVVDVLQSIPAIVLILMVLAVIPHNEHVAMVTLGIVGSPAVIRIVRASALRVREELYVAAARVSGLTHARIVIRHVLPRVRGPIIVQASLFAAFALLFETGLSFLGLTADPATPTWGGMVAEGSQVLLRQSWLLIPTGATIAVTILAFGILGDAIGDITVERERVGQPARARVSAESRVAVPTDEPEVAAQSTLLRVTDLRVAVEGDGRTIVDAVSLGIDAGETVGLVGESGCGKTMTALSVLRLLPAGVRVVHGRIELAGCEISALPDKEFRRLRGSEVAYVSQEPQTSLDPLFTVGSQLLEVIRRHDHVSRKAAQARVLELLQLVQLADPRRVAASHAHELSGGMAQRVAIALALAGRPRLLIADEPTTALDVTIQAGLLALLRELQDETGMAILLITHNWGVVAETCDRALVMYAGQIVEQADVAQIFGQPLHPYTRGLLASRPAAGTPKTVLSAITGGVPEPGSWATGCRFAPRCPLATELCRAAAVPMREVRRGRYSRCVHADQLIDEEAAVAG